MPDAISEFAKFDHRVPLARAETNRVGNGWDLPVGTAIRDDARSYLPLNAPSGLAPPPPPEPTPSPPTEAQLREVLAQAIVSMRDSNEQLADAETTAELARHHVEACRSRLAEFDDVEAEATAATIAALRGGSGRLDRNADDTIQRKRLDRETARADLAAAEAAQGVLAGDLTDAMGNVEKASKAAHTAAVGVLAITAEMMAKRVLDLESEASRTRETLIAFDRIAANSRLPLPQVVLDVVSSDPTMLMKPVDVSTWRRALDLLLTDAAAEVTIAIPERRPTPPTVRFNHGVITRMVPLRPLRSEEPAPVPAPESEVEAVVTPAEV